MKKLIIDRDDVLILCRDHVEAAKGYERIGNVSAAMQLRSVANMLGALANGAKCSVISPAPTTNGASDFAIERLRVIWRALGKEVEDLANGKPSNDEPVLAAGEVPRRTMKGPRDADKFYGTHMLAKLGPESKPPPDPKENLATMSEERFREVFPPAADARAVVAQVHKANATVNAPRCEHRIVCALAMYRASGGLLRGDLAIATGYSTHGGGFLRAVGQLKTAGVIRKEGNHKLCLTGERHSSLKHPSLAPVEVLAVCDELVSAWCMDLVKAEREVLLYLWGVAPALRTKHEIAKATNYEPGGGGFLRALGRLRTLGLIVGRSNMQCAPMLHTRPA